MSACCSGSSAGRHPPSSETVTAVDGRFPLGAAITLDELDADPYPALARPRAEEPVSRVPVLDGWLVTRRDLCIEVRRGRPWRPCWMAGLA